MALLRRSGLFAAAILWAIASAHAASTTDAPASITFYLEKTNSSNWALNHKNDPNFVVPHFSFQIFVDGKYFARMHTNRFVTLTLPAGHHEVRTANSERRMVELASGEHTYIRPEQTFRRFGGFHAMPESLAVKACRDVRADIGDGSLLPVKSGDIHFGDISPEYTFPTCH